MSKSAGFRAIFALAGAGLESSNSPLNKLIVDLQLENEVKLIGPQSDMPTFYAALDIVTLTSSRGEGFPNVVVEAMASGLPVVCTNTGDEASIVGNCGTVVGPRDPGVLSAAWRTLSEMTVEDRAQLGRMARIRVLEKYSQTATINAYAALYKSLVR
jgi:glycosyltransferase involved in cell wall biosynthesis